MPMFVRGGWMIPSDNLVRWWNRNYRHEYRRDIFSELIKHGDSGAGALYKCLHQIAYRDSSAEEEYDCFTIFVGPPFKQKPYVLIMTHSGLFDVQLEGVRRCDLTPRSVRAQRVKILLEAQGLNFESNDVQFYKMPICMI